jgi:hypothetical protein
MVLDLIDLRWLFVLPLGLIMAFVVWVMWDIAREIGAQKRRWVRSYRGSRMDGYKR